jgi:hypothetical protein
MPMGEFGVLQAALKKAAVAEERKQELARIDQMAIKEAEKSKQQLAVFERLIQGEQDKERGGEGGTFKKLLEERKQELATVDQMAIKETEKRKQQIAAIELLIQGEHDEERGDEGNSTGNMDKKRSASVAASGLDQTKRSKTSVGQQDYTGEDDLSSASSYESSSASSNESSSASSYGSYFSALQHCADDEDAPVEE